MLLQIEQEYDGMWCEEYSEPFEYDNGCTEACPSIVQNEMVLPYLNKCLIGQTSNRLTIQQVNFHL